MTNLTQLKNKAYKLGYAYVMGYKASIKKQSKYCKL